MTRSEFENSEFKNLDIDEIHKNMSETDYITIGKSAFIYPNTRPEEFRMDKITCPKYCKVAFGDESDQRIDATTVKSTKKYLIKKITAIVHFSEFDPCSQTSIKMTKETAEFSSLHEINHPLVFVNATHSKESDISLGSIGSRSVSMYYDIGGATLSKLHIKL